MHVCRACAGLDTEVPAPRVRATTGQCVCGAEAAVHELLPVVDGNGQVSLCCPRCQNRRADSTECAVGTIAPLASEPTPETRGRNYATVGIFVVAIILAVLQLRAQIPANAEADSLLASPSAYAESAAMVSAAAFPLRLPAASASAGRAIEYDRVEAEAGDHKEDDQGSAPEGMDPEEFADELPDIANIDLPPTQDDLLEAGNAPLEQWFPTLKDWVFPVFDSKELLPLKASRRFGAEREGVARAECGRGHCGVDLGGPRGTPIVAVAVGEVVRIERRPNRRSGRYVRIEHPDYVYTSYMHLDEIATGLRVGDEVQAGQKLGTLGRTGILFSAPHLHFSLQLPMGRRWQHIDPMPYLEHAERIDEAP